MSTVIHIETISEMHTVFGLPKPKHPLVSIVRYKDITVDLAYHNIPCVFGMYCVTLKDAISGSMRYGRNSYDFQEGSMLFIQPGQVLQYEGHHSGNDALGWALLFHPDLIGASELARSIDKYSYFSYDTTEALHVSEEEKIALESILKKIEKEYSQNLDRHSQKLIISNIELLLDYCTRYYDRQFYTRSHLNKDFLSRFELLLTQYYKTNKQLDNGVPSVSYCGEVLGISPKYLSDLLKRETGYSAKALIDNFILKKAKIELLNSNQSVGEIAFSLGFEYSQHFSKLFKVKSGMSPTAYRTLNNV